MKRVVLGALVFAAWAGSALAANNLVMVKWEDALGSPEGQAQIDRSITFKFGANTMPTGADRKAGDVIIKMIKKGNDRRDDVTACRRAGAAALAELATRAKQAGADGAVNVVSHWRDVVQPSSATEYECHAGGTGGHVQFKGDLVKLAN